MRLDHCDLDSRLAVQSSVAFVEGLIASARVVVPLQLPAPYFSSPSALLTRPMSQPAPSAQPVCVVVGAGTGQSQGVLGEMRAIECRLPASRSSLCSLFRSGRFHRASLCSSRLCRCDLRAPTRSAGEPQERHHTHIGARRCEARCEPLVPPRGWLRACLQHGLLR